MTHGRNSGGDADASDADTVLASVARAAKAIREKALESMPADQAKEMVGSVALMVVRALFDAERVALVMQDESGITVELHTESHDVVDDWLKTASAILTDARGRVGGPLAAAAKTRKGDPTPGWPSGGSSYDKS